MIFSLFFATVLALEPTTDRFGVASSGDAHGGEWVTDERFVADERLGSAVRFDFSVEIAEYAAMQPEGSPMGVAAMVPARFDDGSYGCWCWGDGRWYALECEAVGLEKTLEGRFETRTVGGIETVSYFVKVGGEYVRLGTASGRVWFRGGVPGETRGVAFSGAGEIVSFTGFDDEVSLEGCVVDTYPGSGVTEIDGETAATSDLVVLREEGEIAPVVIGGTVRPVVTLDTDRVRIGKPLVATAEGFLGLDLACTYVWERGAPR